MAQNPEQKKSYAVIKKFLGVNTKANRTAIQEDEFSWLENAMPVGPSNLKILPTYSSMGISFTMPVIALFNVNIGSYDYLIAFESDGSAEYVNLETLTKGTLASAGTFTGSNITASCTAGTITRYTTPRTYYEFYAGGTVTGTFAVGMTLVGSNIPANTQIASSLGSGFYILNQPCPNLGPEVITGTAALTGKLAVSQWENTYLLISDPINGYFTWDGISLISVGSIAAIGITDGGNNYTSAPTVTISAPNQANGTQATALCTITNTAGQVLTINMTTVGSGYTSVPKVTIAAPPAGGTQAVGAATIASGQVVAIGVVTPGAGYTSNPSVTITGGGGTGASAFSTIDTGSVNSIILTNAGSGYTSAPTVTFAGGGGTGANAVAGILSFAIGTVQTQVLSGGSGYTNAANVTVTFSGGGGTNAAGKAIISGGQVTQVVMTNIGSGYSTPPSVTISTDGGANCIAATANTIINSSQSVGIESFSGRVWLAQGRTVYYTAAGSITDFVSVSAGSIILADSTLHGNITWLKSANNFLYLFGDDSINVFSDVRVTSTGTTLFTNTNISASVGSKRAYSIFPYFRSVLFANDYGVYALVGSTTTKVSDALDGVFPYINFDGPVYGCQVLLNNILCAAFNFEYTGPGGNGSTYPGRYIQAIFFDKKWFFTSGPTTMPYMVSVPVNGKITTYGCDGTNLYQLYSDTQSNVSSYVQTALLPMGDPIRTKQALKFGVEGTANLGGPVTITVDSEQNSSPNYVVIGSGIGWVNNSGNTVTWVNSSNVTVAWNQSGSAYWLYKSDAAQWGKYIGLTIQTSQPQFVVNTIEFEHELRTRF